MRGRAAWPIVLCAALSVALGLGLHALAGRRDGLSFSVLRHVLEVHRPRALLLVALLPWLWLGVLISLTDMSVGQRLLQAGCRTLLLLCLCLGLSRPALQGERQTVSEVVLLDVSASMTPKQLDAATALIADLRRLAAERRDELHLVTFAAHPQAVALPSPGQPLPAPVPPEAERGGTDIQAALQLAYGLHSPATLKRVLLLSDGNETEGDIVAEAQAARGRGIRLDHRPLQKEQDEEVLVQALRLAGGASADHSDAELKVGAPFYLEAEVYASAPQRVRVTLLRDGVENPGDGQREVDLVPGRNVVRFRSEAGAAGYLTYRVQIGPSTGEGAPLRDHFAGNNQALLPLSIKGRPRVLYIEGEPAARGYLSRALSQENIDVDTRNAYGLPASAKELARFDLVLLSDVPSTLVSQAQMQALETYVRDLGGGFVMTGGENSFGSGGYQGTLVEKVLPVRFEQEKKRDQPSLALVLCIDRSGSMNGPKLELAKDAAKATAELLGPDDLIGVVAFDSQAIPLVRLQRAQNRVRISSDISRLQAGGGTQILPPLQEAYQQLMSVAAKIKHVILLTDGQAEYQGILELVDQMVAQKITVSAVGVGTGADQTLLTAIAEHGGGRFYFTQDATSIPKIFAKETTQVARSALVEDRIRVVVSKRVELLDGTGIEGAPPLRGYVATKPKPLAEVLLSSPQGEPILARWRLGLGQALAFTSDVKNRWAVEWLKWPGYGRFWAQLVRSSMRHDPRTRGTGYDLRAEAFPPRVHVSVDAVSADDRFISGLSTTLEVIAPSPGQALLGRKVATAPLPQTAPGRYEGDVELREHGAYLLRAVHRQGEGGPVVAESWGSLALSYPREYLALPPDEARLMRASAVTGGKRLLSATEALDPGTQRVRYLRELWPYLCGLALLLLLLDVALRRVRILGYRPLSL